MVDIFVFPQVLLSEHVMHSAHSQTLTSISANLKPNIIVFMKYFCYEAWLNTETLKQIPDLYETLRQSPIVRVPTVPSADRLRSPKSGLCFLWFFSMTRQLILSVSSFPSINHGKTMEPVETSLFTTTTSTTSSSTTSSISTTSKTSVTLAQCEDAVFPPDRLTE